MLHQDYIYSYDILLAALNDRSLWSLLLNFCCNLLSKPSRSGKRHTLISNIRKRLSNIFSIGNTSVNCRSIKPNKGYKTPSLANLVANKMEDGDTTASIRLICSEEKPMYDSEVVYVKLTERHPAPNKDRQQFNYANLTAAIQLSEKEVFKAIRSFPAGSSGVSDGVRPKHILDLVSCKIAGHKFLAAITGFVNMLLDGVCHPHVIPVLFSGILTALIKN